MHSWTIRLAACVSIGLVCSTAFSAPNEACSSALTKESNFSSLSTEDKIRIGLSFDQTTYDTLNQGASGNLAVPIYGVPVQIGGSWSDAKTHQDQLKENYDFASGSSSASLYASAKVSEAGYAAYRDCLYQNAVGLNLAIEKITGNTVKVHVIFNSAAGDEAKRKMKVSAVKAHLLTGPDVRPIPSNKFDQEFTFQRDDAESIVVISAVVFNNQNSILEAKSLDGVPPEPKLRRRNYLLSPTRAGGAVSINFSSGTPTNKACVAQTNPEGKFRNFQLVYEWKDHSAPPGWNFYDGPVVDQGTQICQTFGCTSSANTNCSAVAHAVVQELVPGPWTAFP